MKIIAQITALLMLPFALLHAIEWKKGELIPESKAIVKTIDEIIKDAKIPPPVHITPPVVEQSNDPALTPNFTAATFDDSGMVPPDAMGVVGPTQFILGANGRVRSFDKKSGKMDLAIDISTNLFFTPVSRGSLTSDSRIRYDRTSDRWYIMILAVNPNPVRIMLAVSDSGIITPLTKWSFYFFEPRTDKNPDYPTIGIDKNALYIGANIMDFNGKYSTSDGIVIQKKPLLAGTLKAFLFKDLVLTRNFIGPTTPQGVDNFDPNPTDGYIIGIDGLNTNLMVRRIKDPGGEPSISDNIAIPVENADWPLQVPQMGSLKTKKFLLQGFDNRLCSPHIRNNLLYAGHNVAVDNKGSDITKTATRDGCKWYEISLKDPDHPKIAQSGILYQPSKENDTEERFYWTPGIMTNGLQTMMICCSASGDQEFANGAYVLRYSNDPPGTLREPHLFTHSHVVYTLGFPPYENLRWGEYSHVSVDPLDNMTFWDIAEFSYKENSWGLQVVRIPAGHPAKMVKITPEVVQEGQNDVRLTISGVRENGSAFYDPGEGFSKRLKVEIEDAKVNLVKWISPEIIELVITTGKATGNELKTVKITNPDGQSVESKELLKIVPAK